MRDGMPSMMERRTLIRAQEILQAMARHQRSRPQSFDAALCYYAEDGARAIGATVAEVDRRQSAQK